MGMYACARVLENGLFDNCARIVVAYRSNLYAMYSTQTTTDFPRPNLCACVCEACDLLTCSNLLCYTTPKFPCKFYKDNKIYLIYYYLIAEQ